MNKIVENKVNPFVRFEEMAKERGMDRLDAMSFVSRFQWYHRSEHDCPRFKWCKGLKECGLHGTYDRYHFNMGTVYAYCEEQGESVWHLLNWLDEAARLVEEMECLCEESYWHERLHGEG